MNLNGGSLGVEIVSEDLDANRERTLLYARNCIRLFRLLFSEMDVPWL